MNDKSTLKWISASKKPKGWERRVLGLVDWSAVQGRSAFREHRIIWWKHGPGCFAFDDFENADHLVTMWCELPEIPYHK